MMKIYFVIAIFILSACSMLPPSANEFKNIMEHKVGRNIKSDDFYGTVFYKIEHHKDNTFYYKKHYINNTDTVCRTIYIVNKDDIIIDYKILTPNTCKLGIPPVW